MAFDISEADADRIRAAYVAPAPSCPRPPSASSSPPCWSRPSNASKPNTTTADPGAPPAAANSNPSPRPASDATPPATQENRTSSNDRGVTHTATQTRVPHRPSRTHPRRLPRTRAILPPSTLSEFLEAAVLETIERLETEHNNGRPWDVPSAGEIKSTSQTGVGRWNRA